MALSVAVVVVSMSCGSGGRVDFDDGIDHFDGGGDDWIIGPPYAVTDESNEAAIDNVSGWKVALFAWCMVSDVEHTQFLIGKTSGDWKAKLFQPALRMPLIIGIGLALLQQLSGINTVMYYAPTIFKFPGFQSVDASILAAVGLGVVKLCSHVAALFMIDRVGRRPFLLIGIAGWCGVPFQASV
jgi:MFS family permease